VGLIEEDDEARLLRSAHFGKGIEEHPEQESRGDRYAHVSPRIGEVEHVHA